MRLVIWTAILAPVPYSLSRLLWALGIPLGIDEALLRDFDSPGLGSLYILALALLPEATAMFTHTFVLTRAARVPDRVPGVGGRPVRPGLIVAPLLAPIVILGGFNLWSLGPILDGFVIPSSERRIARMVLLGPGRQLLDLGRLAHGRDRRLLAGGAARPAIRPAMVIPA